MNQRFADRREAGRKVAARLGRWAGRDDVVVLALPRGGLPVAREVAQALDAPLDVLVVRRLAVPGEEGLTFGAVASRGLRVVNRRVADACGVSAAEVERVSRREAREAERAEAGWRGDGAPLELRGRVVLLVDDGVASGASMRAAVAVVRAGGAARVVVVVPVVAREAYLELRAHTHEFITLQIPKEFGTIRDHYENCTEVDDEAVGELLAAGVT